MPNIPIIHLIQLKSADPYSKIPNFRQLANLIQKPNHSILKMPILILNSKTQSIQLTQAPNIKCHFRQRPNLVQNPHSIHFRQLANLRQKPNHSKNAVLIQKPQSF